MKTEKKNRAKQRNKDKENKTIKNVEIYINKFQNILSEYQRNKIKTRLLDGNN